MFCPKCGTKAEPGDRFCGKCGFPLGEAGDQQTQTGNDQAQQNGAWKNPMEGDGSWKNPAEQTGGAWANQGGNWDTRGSGEEYGEPEYKEPKKPKWWLFILLGVILVALIAVLLVLIFMKDDRKDEDSSSEMVQEVLEEGESAEENGDAVTGGDAPEDFDLGALEDSGEEAASEPTATPTPTPEPEPELVTDSGDIAQIRQDYWRVGEENILNYSASSTIQQDNGVINPPIYLFDNDDQTNWQEGVEDSGEGEFLSFAFDQEYQISAMTFRLGNWKSDTYYHGNNRPKTLRLELGDYSWSVTFPDEWQEFGVRFTSPVSSADLKITLEEVYEGTDWDDTAITEVGVWYR